MQDDKVWFAIHEDSTKFNELRLWFKKSLVI